MDLVDCMLFVDCLHLHGVLRYELRNNSDSENGFCNLHGVVRACEHQSTLRFHATKEPWYCLVDFRGRCVLGSRHEQPSIFI